MLRPLLPVLLFAATAAATAAAAPPEVTPVPPPEAAKWAELKVAAGKLNVLSAQPASTWEAVDDLDLRTFETGKFAVFVAPAGRYRVTVTAPDGQKARIVLVVGDAPVPPGPRPPDPPPPVDALKAKLKAAFDADGSPRKSDQAKDLAALYRQAVALCADPAVATAGDLLARVKAASTTLVGADALKGVRAVVAGELAAVLPTDAPLSGDQRRSVAALFARFAEVLDGFSP
jgi:hypothetical protein